MKLKLINKESRCPECGKYTLQYWEDYHESISVCKVIKMGRHNKDADYRCTSCKALFKTSDLKEKSK